MLTTFRSSLVSVITGDKILINLLIVQPCDLKCALLSASDNSQDVEDESAQTDILHLLFVSYFLINEA